MRKTILRLISAVLMVAWIVLLFNQHPDAVHTMPVIALILYLNSVIVCPKEKNISLKPHT